MDTGTFITVYNVILFLAVIVATWIVAVTWRWRRVPGSTSLMIQMAGEGIWTLCYALQLSGFIHPASQPNFWGKLLFVGVVMVPGAFLVWVARYTKRDAWVNSRTIALLCIEPVVFNLLIWTDPWHGWFSGTYTTTGQLGIAFWLHTLYSYVLLMIGAVMLILNWLQMQPAYRKQAFLVLLGLPISTAANVVTVAYLMPQLRIDLSPLGFLAAGAIFTYAQLRHRLFDILPVARHKVMDGMRDGVMVLDNDDRIIDMNPAAKAMLGTSLRAAQGMSAQTVIPAWQEFLREGAGNEDGSIELLMETDDNRHLDLTLTVMRDQRSQPGGKLMILRDVTHVKKIEDDLRLTNLRLTQKLGEIESLQAKLQEQAIRDPLTGLYNRRFLEETLSRELAQASRAHEPMSLAMLDLDHFKNINDTYGHDVGDLFLKALADMLEKQTRGGDVACRYGGEEFIVVMPGAPLEIAAARINEFRQAFGAVKINAGGTSISATFSAGVAGFPLHGADEKTIITTADHALYAAKASGRNRVIVAQREFL
ncbi:MAG: diguanylate cyclase [Smithellaceae bacterium]